MTISLKNSLSSIESIRTKLSNVGIETRPGFKPASEHEYLKGKIKMIEDTKVSKALHKVVISLPTYPELTDSEIEHVCNELKIAIRNKSE
jgi:dTDP-4-amino-4,6-dideoxygalactose transaminase